ncbi:DUF1931 family protein [Streptomyces collinus]|uniref:DUF1931 family protein n=1 Tax=Streptomyces collinus TaxID=42684 RepID=UPI0036877950
MTVMGLSKFERFFRAAASLDVDKNDLKRYGDFVGAKLYDLLVVGRTSAKANGRDSVEPWDLPIAKGLQESVHRYPEIIGGLSVALAGTLKIMYRDVKNPRTSRWEGVTAVFDRLL